MARYEPTRPDDAGPRVRLRELAGERGVVRLSASWVSTGARGYGAEPQEAAADLSGERIECAPPWRLQACAAHQVQMTISQGPNQRCSLHFVSEAFACGRRFRILCVVDDFMRECQALMGDMSLSGAGVARELDGLVVVRGKSAANLSASQCAMAPSSPRPQSCAGHRNTRSNGITSHRASRLTMPLWNRSTGGSEMNA